MFRETEPNMPADKHPRRFGLPEIGFTLGGLLAFSGIALVFLPAALLALGALLMAVTWRAA